MVKKLNKKVKRKSPKKKGKQNSKAAVAAAKAQSNPPTKKVFVGNLPTTITDKQLTKYFKECGKVVNIYRMSKKTVVRGQEVKKSFSGKVIIGFETIEQAAIAVAKNGEDCFGQNIATNFVKPRETKEPDEKKRQSKKKKNNGKPAGCDTIYVGNIPSNTADGTVRDHFKECGVITRIDKSQSKRDNKNGNRAVFIKFTDPDVALPIAMEMKENATEINGNTLGIEYQERSNLLRKKPDGCAEIFIWNVPPHFCNGKFKELFKDCGKIEKLKWKKIRNKRGLSGIMKFADPDLALPIAVKLNNTEFHGNTLHIGYSTGFKKRRTNEERTDDTKRVKNN